MHSENRILPERVYSLDALRGVAALAVVFWHWQHFFFAGTGRNHLPREEQPFYEFASLLYNRGHLGVQLFFCLSGFVFFWLYAEKLSERRIAVSKFATDRFSRLYPLHLASFALVALLQFLYQAGHGSSFVYRYNDAYHAVLNLLLVPAWGIEKGWSFNAPIWSVSIEVIMYLAFALACMTKNLKYLVFAALIVIGFALPPELRKLAVGLKLFFIGGASYVLFRAAALRWGSRATALGLVCLSLTAWAYVSLAAPGTSSVTHIVFPLTVATLAALNSVRPGWFRSIAFLGDMSYAFYLLHFPLQLIFVLVSDALGYSRAVFLNPGVMISFFAVLITLSHFSYRLFEMPVQNMIRSAYRNRTKSALA
jgi:peptidoglycan/LPS O-acetylase OafA/YrhL